MRAPGTRHGGGMTFERLRSSVSRDAYSDYLPMVAWVEEEEAFLCIDDGWGQAWELVPSAYLFAHVHFLLRFCFLKPFLHFIPYLNPISFQQIFRCFLNLSNDSKNRE